MAPSSHDVGSSTRAENVINGHVTFCLPSSRHHDAGLHRPIPSQNWVLSFKLQHIPLPSTLFNPLYPMSTIFETHRPFLSPYIHSCTPTPFRAVSSYFQLLSRVLTRFWLLLNVLKHPNAFKNVHARFWNPAAHILLILEYFQVFLTFFNFFNIVLNLFYLPLTPYFAFSTPTYVSEPFHMCLTVTAHTHSPIFNYFESFLIIFHYF
jgi:hypothetical protein